MDLASRAAGIAVLYIHPGGAFSGSLRSLLDLLQGLPAGAVRPRVLVPRGPAAAELQRHGHEVLAVHGLAQLDSTRYGHYRGARWLILLRELYLLPFSLWGILRARSRWRDIDLIHANEITVLPVALLARAVFGKPLVVHVRSVQLAEGAPLRRKLLRAVLRRFADAVVAIDDTVRASLAQDITVHVVRNGFTPEAPHPAGALAAAARFHAGSLRVGMVGSLLALKGVDEFLEAARDCVANGANVDFVLAGASPRDVSGPRGWLLRQFGFARDLVGDIERFLREHDLAGRVHLTGHLRDVGAVYRSLDVVCFPSHLGAVGRPVLEAAWFGVPCIAAAGEARPDTFSDGETGVCVAAQDPGALARAIMQLEARREEVRRLGRGALELARRNFDSRRNAAEMLALYEKVREARKRSVLAA